MLALLILGRGRGAGIPLYPTQCQGFMGWGVHGPQTGCPLSLASEMAAELAGTSFQRHPGHMPVFQEPALVCPAATLLTILPFLPGSAPFHTNARTPTLPLACGKAPPRPLLLLDEIPLTPRSSIHPGLSFWSKPKGIPGCVLFPITSCGSEWRAGFLLEGEGRREEKTRMK